MKKNYLKLLVVVILCWMATEAKAQWTLGVKAGWDRTAIDRSLAGRIDETYAPLSGFETGVFACYQLNDWFAIRADFAALTRSYRMDRHLHYLDPVFTEYRNDYLMIPVVADFSFGGRKLRGHTYLGGFGANWVQAYVEGKTYWMTDYYVYYNDFHECREFNEEDRLFIAGVVGGLGLSYNFYDPAENGGGFIVSLDVLDYYDLVSHHKGYAHLSDPRYLNSLSVLLGIAFKF